MVENIKIAIYLFFKKKQDLVDSNNAYLTEEIKLRKEIYELKRELQNRPDERDLMRNMMDSVSLDMNVKDNFLSGYSKAEIQNFNKFGYELAENKWWKMFVAWSINSQTAKVVGNIPHDNNKDLFGAGVIDGIMFMRDMVENRRDAHLLDTQPEETFDKNQVIQN